jgi:hypothetical protein
MVDERTLKRFWSKVDRKGPDECWEWTGFRMKFGHGRLRFSGKKMLAHRLAWELSNGSIPATQGGQQTCVCHRCDNPPCCNPAHLFLGSRADNNADRDNKGRQGAPRGESSNFAKLNSEQVLEIRRMCDTGAKQRDIARIFGVHQGLISCIHLRKVWAHV